MNRPTLPNRKRDSSGRVPTMKGCLKSPIPSPGLGGCPTRKSVAFGEEICEEVYFADVWDRTPTEPARKLTYQDLLELKEIQRSLPRANQLPDPISGKPASHFLNQVPIGLLPLLSESDSTSPSSSSESSSTATSPAVTPPSTPVGLPSQPWGLPRPTPRPQPPPVVSKPWAPPHLQHLLPKSPPPQRPKPSFAFIPLLETPPSSAAPSPFNSCPTSRSPSPDRDFHSDTDHSQDPPTPSLTNASLESSPQSRASSASPEPPFLSLSDHDFEIRGRRSPYSERHTLHNVRTRSTSPHALSTTTAWHAFPDRSKNRPPSISPQRSDTSTSSASEYNPPRRRRNVMIVNGIEIDLDDDDDEDDGSVSESSTPSTSNPYLGVPLLPPISPPSARTPTRQLSPDLERNPPSPKLSCSPSSPGRCSISLHTPIRFQRDKSMSPHNMGLSGIASP